MENSMKQRNSFNSSNYQDRIINVKNNDINISLIFKAKKAKRCESRVK